MPFPRFHIFSKKCLFTAIVENVVNSWNSSSIMVLLFTNFLTWEFFHQALSFSLFEEFRGEKCILPPSSTNNEQLRVDQKKSQVKKLANTNTIILDEFEEFTTFSNMAVNRHFFEKMWNRGKGIFVNIFTVKPLQISDLQYYNCQEFNIFVVGVYSMW